ncbi:MAG: hypothetical protein KME54_29400 [Tolypothrix brevis GSE-NOS-MK-07-07A]|jgi:hypothetical protein|nr:hypothetical protein [Tolypothrix brevis GSE-NOS-MK-07-07A]
MADFPVFGGAQRAAPLFQKELFPNVEFETNVSSPPSSAKTVNVKISIVNLLTTLVPETLDRLFVYALASASQELTTSSLPIETAATADIHFQIDITKASFLAGNPQVDSQGNVTGQNFFKTVKTANIDILIENLQIPSLEATLSRIKAYMVNAVATDMNP